jgi:hypothetical protein
MPKTKQFSERDLPRAGSVFLVPLEDGRFGVVRVLRTKSQGGAAAAFVVPSSWIGNTAARPSDRDIRLPLFLTHHSWANQLEALWVVNLPPPSFIPVGTIEIMAADNAIEREAYSVWEDLPLQILLQWRWDNDREALLVEDAARKAKENEARKITNARRAELLETVTLAEVSKRIWFGAWDEELDGPNLSASQRLVANLVHDLQTAPKLTKVVARRLLQSTVKKFNHLDRVSQFIETTHREDICEAFEIIMAAARYPELAEEVEEWRDW